MQFRIGNLLVDNNLILAPMAGVTDLPFRLLCKEQGCGMLYSEMVSAKALHYNNSNTYELLKMEPEEAPMALQLFGSEPEIMAEAVEKLNDMPFATFDVNMGCPVPKVVNNREGSALMRNPELAGKIVEAMVKVSKKLSTIYIQAKGRRFPCEFSRRRHFWKADGLFRESVSGDTFRRVDNVRRKN